MIPASEEWHSHTFKIDDANFGNSWGWNFRIERQAQDVWIKQVTVKRAGAKK